jgi:hypothetical protein
MSRALHGRWRHEALPFDLEVLVDEFDDPEAQPAAGAEPITPPAAQHRQGITLRDRARLHCLFDGN